MHFRWGYTFRVRIPGESHRHSPVFHCDSSSLGMQYECVSLRMHILAWKENVTHWEYTASPRMHIFTGNPHSLYRMMSCVGNATAFEKLQKYWKLLNTLASCIFSTQWQHLNLFWNNSYNFNICLVFSLRGLIIYEHSKEIPDWIAQKKKLSYSSTWRGCTYHDFLVDCFVCQSFHQEFSGILSTSSKNKLSL